MYSYNTCHSERDIKITRNQDNPLDTIQSIYWDKNENSNMFLTSGWDAILSLYSIDGYPQKIQQKTKLYLQQPIITTTMDRNYNVFTGHINGQINLINLQNNQKNLIGKHSAPIRGLFWIQQIDSLLSFGLDDKMHIWNLQSNQNPVVSLQFKKKTSVVDVDYPYVIVGNIEDCFMVFKINNPQQIQIPSYVQSHLGKYSKFNCIAINARASYYASGSIDGQCGIGRFQDNSRLYFDQKIFSMHFLKTQQYNRKTRYYQVNAIGINPFKTKTGFVAGGCSTSSNLIFFNLDQKDKKVKQYKFKTPVTQAKFSPNGKYLAYALGSDWTQGLSQLSKYQAKIMCHLIKQDDLVKLR